MTQNRRRVALSAIIIATVIGWAGAGAASASSKWEDNGEPSKWEGVAASSKWE
jgi:hypothetical protein